MKKSVEKAGGNLKKTFGETIQNNGNLFTIFSVVLILVGGIAMVNGQTTWWLSAIAITAVFLIIFIFINARVMIKAALATILTLFMANSVLQLGIVLSPTTAIGLMWMTSLLFLYCAALALSYLTIGYRSRWTALMMAVIGQVFFTVTFLSTMPLLLVLALATAFALIIFFSYYKWLGALLVHHKEMPTNSENKNAEINILNAGESTNWNVRKLEKKFRFSKRRATSFLAWNDKHAYLIHPIDLDNKLSISPSKKAVKLVHNGYSINSWLLNLVSSLIPAWRSRNANIMIVLADLENKNGTRTEAIGAAIPDSAKRIPVGITPAKTLTRENLKNPETFLEKVDEEYGVFLAELSEKQKDAMSEIGIFDESAYISRDDEKK